MSPFESQDPQLETITAPKDGMACPPPSGGDGSADGACPAPTTNGDAAASASASDRCVPIEAANKDDPPKQPPQTTRQTCPPANTATGLISPLTTMKQSKGKGGRSPAGILKKHFSTSKQSSHTHSDRSVPTTPQVDSYCISKIGQARQKIKRSFDGSKLLENDEYVFPRFEMGELTLGEVLGRGGFGTVLEIKAMEVAPPPEPSEGEGLGAFSGRSSLFRIDDVEDAKHKRKRSHSFRLRRRSRDGPHHGVNTIPFSNSHDGCEGLTEGALESIPSGKPLQVSKSHDCVDGDGGSSPTAAAGTTIGKGGRRIPKRELRTKALSWSNAKAAAHDVSHFFHRSPRHHDAAGNVVETGDHEQKENIDALNEALRQEMKGRDGERPREARQKSVSYDDSLLRRGAAAGGVEVIDGSNRGTPKRVSRNFSFRSWRDSEAGEEGNDAISLEELAQYNIDRTFYSTLPGTSIHTLDSSADDAAVKVDDEVDSAPPSRRSSFADELVVEPDASNRGRRMILYSTPKNSFLLEPLEEEVRSSGTNYEDKKYMTENTTTKKGEARYAIKIISPHIVENDFKKFLQAAMDMATETYFLSVLNHPHILKMRAVGQGDMFSPSYFLVLDRLYDTLCDKILGPWKTQLDHLENSLLVWNRAAKLRALWEERMIVMRDLAGALNYLHELKCIYRDLKPENVGFDAAGRVKLFDFGLAKECSEDDECANGTYKLTPNTGSIRYMAPENGNKWPYNFMADSYSFGILLWEVTALERPFASYTPREIRDMVMKWGERPKMKEGWSDRVVGIMTLAWDSNFRKRPTMKVIEETLAKEIEDRGMV